MVTAGCREGGEADGAEPHYEGLRALERLDEEEQKRGHEVDLTKHAVSLASIRHSF